MTKVAEEINKNASSEKIQITAEERLREALENLAKGTSQQFGVLLNSVEDQVKTKIENLTESFIDGVKDLKDEFSLSAPIRRQPWEWMLGAAIAGAAATTFIKRNHNDSSPMLPDQPSISTKNNSSRWLIFAAEVGLALIQAQKKQRTPHAETNLNHPE